jgi:hypothetical protein
MWGYMVFYKIWDFLSKIDKKLVCINVWVFFTYTNKINYEEYRKKLEFW